MDPNKIFLEIVAIDTFQLSQRCWLLSYNLKVYYELVMKIAPLLPFLVHIQINIIIETFRLLFQYLTIPIVLDILFH